jgi:hypothetical protein
MPLAGRSGRRWQGRPAGCRPEPQVLGSYQKISPMYLRRGSGIGVSRPLLKLSRNGADTQDRRQRPAQPRCPFASQTSLLLPQTIAHRAPPGKA